jgi:hydroxymethylglutaryl-CoA reductase (NADPH)
MEKIAKKAFFPSAQLYTRDYISKRVEWLRKRTKSKLYHITQYSGNPEKMKGNIENLIGVTQIPLGVIGPLKIKGAYAKGNFYIPLATTEGALVLTYQRGAYIITKSGGVTTRILNDVIHISPVFMSKGMRDSLQFIKWINNNFFMIKKEAEKTTKHGKLTSIDSIPIGRRVILRFCFSTQDAHGLNMINKATDAACQFISRKTHREYLLRSNFSSIKKVALSNIFKGYGKAVFAEISIPPEIFTHFHTTPEKMLDYYLISSQASIYSGMIGMNAHIANGITALYIACGQDVADISTSQVGIVSCEITKNRELYVSLYIPNLLVGTVGGGTALSTQRECLEMIGCHGKGKVKKFTEIVGATALAGEIAVALALVTDTYVQAHEKYGRNRP